MDSRPPPAGSPPPGSRPRRRHPIPRASVRRAIYAVLAVIAVEIVGTIGFHSLEPIGWVDAFYFESMLATGQGPPFPLIHDASKIFASVMGFASVGAVVSAIVFTVGPVVVKLWREAVESAESDMLRIEQEAARGVRDIEHALRREKDTPAEQPGGAPKPD
ncbi:MAG: hypothetical protein ACREEC_00595 [Thermoplasmata archaeon]